MDRLKTQLVYAKLLQIGFREASGSEGKVGERGIIEINSGASRTSLDPFVLSERSLSRSRVYASFEWNELTAGFKVARRTAALNADRGASLGMQAAQSLKVSPACFSRLSRAHRVIGQARLINPLSVLKVEVNFQLASRL